MSDKKDLAEERTDWAEARTILANERTFAGWMRTGMASVALALGLRALFDPFEPTWIPKLVSTLFIFIALAIFWAAWRNSSETQKELHAKDAQPQSASRIGLIAAILSAGSAAAGAILWLL
ncbi:YidH family protein [Marivita sp.]|jgi:putative membrane protein|uniref:YidH family protein n=1 Tax=Marivita sp. TaxID=2003365 RepID=UPI003F6E81C5